MQNYQALAFFSPTNEELARILEQDPEMRERKIEIAKEEIEPFMREYTYPFSTWPVFISASRHPSSHHQSAPCHFWHIQCHQNY